MTFEKCLDSNVDGSFAPWHDWTRGEIRDLFALPFPDLIYRAQTVHRQHFDPSEVQVSTLLSIKTGGARRTAPIARRARNTTPASRPKSW